MRFRLFLIYTVVFVLFGSVEIVANNENVECNMIRPPDLTNEQFFDMILNTSYVWNNITGNGNIDVYVYDIMEFDVKISYYLKNYRLIQEFQLDDLTYKLDDNHTVHNPISFDACTERFTTQIQYPGKQYWRVYLSWEGLTKPLPIYNKSVNGNNTYEIEFNAKCPYMFMIARHNRTDHRHELYCRPRWIVKNIWFYIMVGCIFVIILCILFIY